MFSTFHGFADLGSQSYLLKKTCYFPADSNNIDDASQLPVLKLFIVRTIFVNNNELNIL